VQTLANVLRRIVAAENGLLLPKASFARANVVVKDGARSYKRFILKSHMGGAELRIFTDGSVVRGSPNSMRCEAARAFGASAVKSTMRR